jgi:hypothetical protein
MIETEQPTARQPWPDFRAVWRWHFYAGLFCIPLIIVMASSGSIYLFGSSGNRVGSLALFDGKNRLVS